MKTRLGFVSNSSSCSFVIKNLTNQELTMLDFAEETQNLVAAFNKYYSWNDHTIEEFMAGVDSYPTIWTPDETKEVIFGDEDGTVMGKIYDYMLRESDRSTSFSWYLGEMLR